MATVKALCVEGGGTLGLASCLALLKLTEADKSPYNNLLETLEFYCGTSAGAIIASAVALGADLEFLAERVQSTPWDKFKDDPSVCRLYKEKGLYSPRFAETFLKDTYRALGWNEDISFGQLLDTRGATLEVPAVSLNRKSLVVFGPRSHPRLPIYKAVLASMSVPFFWPPVEIYGELYVDGGMISNHPMDLVKAAGYVPNETIGLRVDRNTEVEFERIEKLPKFLTKYGMLLIEIIMFHTNNAHVPTDYWSRIIRVNCQEMRGLNFNLTHEDIKNLESYADMGVTSWLKSLEEQIRD